MFPPGRRRAPFVAPLLVLLVAASALAVPPFSPNEFDLAETLLDAGGQPLVGPVDLEYRVWDAPTAGNLLYKQSVLGVPLDADGRLKVRVGPFGAPPSDPDAPLTPVLVFPVGADTGLPQITGDRYYELTVVGEAGPRPRVRFVSTPFALRALEADFTRFAARSGDITTPGGVNAAILDSIWRDWNPDGGPPNDDPLEGIQDTDGDGTPNWLDADNDGDGLPDAAESGPSTNLVTPRLDGFDKMPSASFPEIVTATGMFFDPAMTVSVDGAGVAANVVTPTTVTFQTVPLPPGVYPVEVALPNGETASRDLAFVANAGLPLLPGTAIGAAAGRPVQIRAVGSDRLLASIGNVGVQDFDADGSLQFPGTTFTTGGNATQTALTWDDTGRLRGVREALSVLEGATNAIQVGNDVNDNHAMALGEWTPVEAPANTAPIGDGWAIAAEGPGRLAIGYVRTLAASGATEAVVLSDRDADGSTL